MKKLKRNEFTIEVLDGVRETMFEGRPHIVAPVTILVEGVHNRLLYDAEELAKQPGSWNGLPLPVFHPMDGDSYISANHPDVIDHQSIGRTFNMRYDSSKHRLVGEIWVDVAKATELAPHVLSAIRSGQPLEVSTGLFHDTIDTAGTWTGPSGDEPYDGIVRNMIPDHLALLPGGRGACSWVDGCGVRANDKKRRGTVLSILESIANKCGLTIQEMSHDETRRAVGTAIDGLDNEDWIHFVKDVYDDVVVYEARGNNPNEGADGGPVLKLYRRSYTIDGETNVVTLGDDVEEVREKKEYVPVRSESSANEDDEVNDSKEKKTMKKDELIQVLIDCDRTRFTKDDEEWLKSLEVDRLETLRAPDAPTTNDEKKVDEEKETKPASNVDTNIDKNTDPPPKDEPKTVDDFVANAPDEIRSHLKRAVARDKKAKDKIVTALVDNPRCSFSREQLEGKDIDELEALVELANVDVDYSGRTGGTSDDSTEDDGMIEPTPLWDLDEIRKENNKTKTG